ncbi:MAG: 2-dehydro-3-deoxygalactonokinase [Verrucomicrobia bacterium]|nr:2-dehydro-3-deoxygalactonokinase [Verrucomicrobiota bacterium]
MKAPALFLSCDWGTTSFRLRLVSLAERRVVGQLTEPAGVKTINARIPETERDSQAAREAAFAGFLRARVEQLCRGQAVSESDLPLVISGMASSTVGWREAPYATTPFPLDGSALRHVELRLDTAAGALPVYLLSGLSTGADIMRGEESEVLGLMALPEARAVAGESIVILPGTHSKHVFVRHGAITDFRTYMTGELLEVLATQSLLKVSVQWPLPSMRPVLDTGTSAERAAFLAGVEMVRERGLAASLFRVRARSVLDRVPATENGWFLSGLLIGAELLDLVSPATDVPLVLAATEPHRTPYELALTHLGAGNRLVKIPEPTIGQATVLAHARFVERLATHSQT